MEILFINHFNDEETLNTLNTLPEKKIMERNVRNKNNNDEKELFKKQCDCHKPKGLHHFKCVPQHLQFNKYVLEGYRMNLSTWECIKSLFYWHNETFNIYSHGGWHIIYGELLVINF